MYWVIKDMYEVVLAAKEYEKTLGSGRVAWDQLCIPFFQRHTTTLTLAAVLYLPMTFLLVQVMKRRRAFKLKWPLRLWNLFQFLFSLWGMIYMTGPVVRGVLNQDTYTSICSLWCFELPPMVGVAAGFFNFFKFLEFTDTLFIVLRKRPLIFLHWYHHILTMLMCWYGNQYAHLYNCAGVFFVPMNFVVHTFMYFYYFLCSMGYRPKWDFYVTFIQTVQMVIGCCIMCYSLVCPNQNWYYNGLIGAMYVSYLYLFVRVVMERYVWKTRDARVAAHHKRLRKLEAEREKGKKE